jgi:hypothetical protein
VKQQWFVVVGTELLDLTDDDVMVATIVGLVGAALEIRHRPRQQRYAVWRSVVPDAIEYRVIGLRKVIRKMLLFSAEHIDCEPLSIEIGLQRIGDLGDIP